MMDQSLSDGSGPDNLVEGDPKMKLNDDKRAKKVMRKEVPVKKAEELTEQKTMTIGSATTAGGFVQLPPELLTMIGTNLDGKNDLLSCRQINKTWTALISPILRQRESISFNGLNPPSAHHVSNLISLNGCLENSKKIFGSLDFFPCTRFSFSEITLEEEIVQIFFNLYGTSIRSLHLYKVETNVED